MRVQFIHVCEILISVSQSDKCRNLIHEFSRVHGPLMASKEIKTPQQLHIDWPSFKNRFTSAKVKKRKLCKLRKSEMCSAFPIPTCYPNKRSEHFNVVVSCNVKKKEIRLLYEMKVSCTLVRLLLLFWMYHKKKRRNI